MAKTLAEKIDEMLAGVQSEVDDSELLFKLRTARQLLVTHDEYLQAHRDSLTESDLDEDALQNLRQLGQLERVHAVREIAPDHIHQSRS